MSKLTVDLKTVFLCEFSRKPRTLSELSRWKASEFRSFLLYIGPVVLENVLDDKCLNNFKALNIAMTILLSPGLSKFVEYARDLLEYFVKSYEQIYGLCKMSMNIHGLLHFVDNYERYGPLDLCSAFPFENYMKVLKAMLRKPHKPLEQVVMRYSETGNIIIDIPEEKQSYTLLGPHDQGPLINNITINPQYSTLVLNNFKIKSRVDRDSFFSTNNNYIIKLVNISLLKTKGSVVLVGRKFKQKNDFFVKPIKSLHLGIYIVQQLSDDLSYWLISDVKSNVMIFPCNNNFVAIPLIHT